ESRPFHRRPFSTAARRRGLRWSRPAEPALEPLFHGIIDVLMGDPPLPSGKRRGVGLERRVGAVSVDGAGLVAGLLHADDDLAEGAWQSVGRDAAPWVPTRGYARRSSRSRAACSTSRRIM